MTVHNAMTGSELHETKGAAAASKGFTLVANGAGTAAYQALLGNVVQVNQLSDFPTAAGGKITLAAGICYLLGANVNIGTDFLLFSAGSSVASTAPFLATLTYTGTVPMFQGEDVSGSISALTVSCANADLINFDETGAGGTKILLVESVLVLSCKAVGTFDKFGTAVLNGMTVLACTDGIVITGSVMKGLRMTSISYTSTDTGFVGIDVTGATIETVNFDGMILTGGAGSIGIKGDAGSANIAANFIANVSNVQFQGVTTPLSGITVDDIRWNFQGNGLVEDTMADAMASLTANATNTVLAVGVPSLVAGTWVAERESHFTTSTAGRLTYNGERDVTTPVDVVLNLNPVSGTSKVIRAYIALNGTVIANSGKSIKIDNGDPLAIPLLWQLTLTTTDYLEVFIENETDSVDVLVIDAIIRAR